jgi:hypothetical protein
MSESPSQAASDSAFPVAKLLQDLEGVRRFTLDRLEPVTASQAMAVMPGCRNHLHWHLGHLLYVMGSALYVRAGEPAPVPKSYRDYFGNGTEPEGYDSLVPDWDELLARAREMSRDLVAKHAHRAGQPLVKPLRLMNIPARTVAEAIPFLLVHEGDHLSRIKQITAWLAKSP